MKEKVIFDTNIARNTGINTFLGSRVMLEHFMQDADIVIPEVVIQEIKRQKRSALSSNKDKFLTNPFHKLIGIDELVTKSFDIEEYIQKLLDAETISFEVIDLKDNNVLTLIKEHAIHKKAPFESGENTDKGFKDALIYFSVLEYLQEIPNKIVFVCAKDARLKEALNQHQNIIVIETYEEFKQHSVSQFFDNYFIEKVNEELGLTISKENIIEYWHNIEDNKNVLIKIENEEYRVEVDTGEIIKIEKSSDFSPQVERLINSNDVENSKRITNYLASYVNYFSNEEIHGILEAAYANEHIKWFIEDDDIKEFIGTLYLARKELVNGDTAAFLEEKFQ